MAKTFKTLEESTKFIIDTAEKTQKQSVLTIANEHLKDSNNLAPIDKGTLRNSGKVLKTDKTMGRIGWGVAYAKRLWYEGSKTAPKKWGIVALKENKDKYKKMYINLFNNNKK
jgi:hypothetical protein